MRLPLWTAALLIVGWGLWQFAAFRRTLIAKAAETPVAVNTSPLPDPPSIDTKSAPPLALPADSTPPSDPLPLDGPAQAPFQNFGQLTAKAASAFDADRIIEGRTAMNAALQQLGDDPRADQLRAQLAALNTPVFLNSALLPEDPLAHYIDIQRGDSFLKFAHDYKVPAAFLESINPNLNPRNLKPATGLKIVRGPFNLRLVKHASRLDLYLRDLYIRSFPIELEDGNYLPRGAYRIKPGTKLQLGPRQWLGFEGIEPATQNLSAGWIYASAGMRGPIDDHTTGFRVSDADLNQLFAVLVESHSTLHILP
jgi:LysM repeat protein